MASTELTRSEGPGSSSRGAAGAAASGEAVPASGAMTGKICLVTGATSGIGEATALALARQGALVAGVGRNAVKCLEVQEKLRERSGNRSVTFFQADLTLQKDVRRLATRFQGAFQRLEVLVNNAGARYDNRLLSPDGYEMTFALNHLGYFLLTNLLLDRIKESGGGRIVNVASGAHWGCPGIDFDDLQGEKGYDGRKAYAQSKLATLLFTYELDRRLEGSGVTVNAVDPGNVLTRFARNNGLISWGRHIIGSLKCGQLLGPEGGAETAVYLASAPELAGISGCYFYEKKAVKSSSPSYDADAAKRLWHISLDLVKLNAPHIGNSIGG
jgi:NAD(P)-dependent dehydrogenase (short-subunit alcohol dehydrogenase family)